MFLAKKWVICRFHNLHLPGCKLNIHLLTNKVPTSLIFSHFWYLTPKFNEWFTWRGDHFQVNHSSVWINEWRILHQKTPRFFRVFFTSVAANDFIWMPHLSITMKTCKASWKTTRFRHGFWKAEEILLMVQKSGVRQLRLVVYTNI